MGKIHTGKARTDRAGQAKVVTAAPTVKVVTEDKADTARPGLVARRVKVLAVRLGADQAKARMDPVRAATEARMVAPRAREVMVKAIMDLPAWEDMAAALMVRVAMEVPPATMVALLAPMTARSVKVATAHPVKATTDKVVMAAPATAVPGRDHTVTAVTEAPVKAAMAEAAWEPILDKADTAKVDTVGHPATAPEQAGMARAERVAMAADRPDTVRAALVTAHRGWAAGDAAQPREITATDAAATVRRATAHPGWVVPRGADRVTRVTMDRREITATPVRRRLVDPVEAITATLDMGLPAADTAKDSGGMDMAAQRVMAVAPQAKAVPAGARETGARPAPVCKVEPDTAGFAAE